MEVKKNGKEYSTPKGEAYANQTVQKFKTMSENESTQDAEKNSAETEKVGTTILYAMTREALTGEDVSALRNALEDEGYFMEKSSDGNNVMIKREEGTRNRNDPLAEL